MMDNICVSSYKKLIKGRPARICIYFILTISDLFLRVQAKFVQHFIDCLRVTVDLGFFLLQYILKCCLLSTHQVEVLIGYGNSAISIGCFALVDVQSFKIKDYSQMVSKKCIPNRWHKLTHALDKITVSICKIELKCVHYGPFIWIRLLKLIANFLDYFIAFHDD